MAALYLLPRLLIEFYQFLSKNKVKKEGKKLAHSWYDGGGTQKILWYGTVLTASQCHQKNKK